MIAYGKSDGITCSGLYGNLIVTLHQDDTFALFVHTTLGTQKLHKFMQDNYNKHCFTRIKNPKETNILDLLRMEKRPCSVNVLIINYMVIGKLTL